MNNVSNNRRVFLYGKLLSISCIAIQKRDVLLHLLHSNAEVHKISFKVNNYTTEPLATHYFPDIDLDKIICRSIIDQVAILDARIVKLRRIISAMRQALGFDVAQ